MPINSLHSVPVKFSNDAAVQNKLLRLFYFYTDELSFIGLC